jgi:hypothetical protein
VTHGCHSIGLIRSPPPAGDEVRKVTVRDHGPPRSCRRFTLPVDGGCGVGQVMAIAPKIDLVPRRQPDLGGSRPDYHVYAGEQLVGRIYESSPASGSGAST